MTEHYLQTNVHQLYCTNFKKGYQAKRVYSDKPLLYHSASPWVIDRQACLLRGSKMFKCLT